MIKSFDISTKIAEYLQNEIDDLQLGKASISALDPVRNYDMSQGNSVALVWLDFVPAYTEPKGTPENGGKFMGAPTKKFMRFAISIGARNSEDLPKLDNLIELVEQNLINVRVYPELSPLRLVTLGQMAEGENKIYWRKLVVETFEDFKIPVRTI